MLIDLYRLVWLLLELVDIFLMFVICCAIMVICAKFMT